MQHSSSKGSSENEKKPVAPASIGELKKDEGATVDGNNKLFQKVLDSFEENTKTTIKADLREKVISKAWELFTNCKDSYKKSAPFERVLTNPKALETHDHLRIIFTELKSHRKISKDNRYCKRSSSFVKQTDAAEKNEKQEKEVVSDSSEKLKVAETSTSKDNRYCKRSSSFVKQTDAAEKNEKQEKEVVSDSSEKLKVAETSTSKNNRYCERSSSFVKQTDSAEKNEKQEKEVVSDCSEKLKVAETSTSKDNRYCERSSSSFVKQTDTAEKNEKPKKEEEKEVVSDCSEKLKVGETSTSKDNRYCERSSSSFVKQTDSAEKNEKPKKGEEKEVVSDSSEKLKVGETSTPSPKENEKTVVNEHRQSWGIDYNTNLFEKFLEGCKEKLMGQSTAFDCEKIILKAWSLFNNCKMSYKESAAFEDLLRQAMNSLSIDPRRQLKIVLDELKYNKKVGCQSLNSALEKPGTSSTVVDPNASETNEEPKDDNVSDTDSLSGVEPDKRNKLKTLERTLRHLNIKIRHLEEREVDLDDENSAYVKLDRYRDRFVKVYEKICELKKKSADAGRPIKRNVSFAGTGFADVERAVEKYYNKTKAFPDFHDILKLTTEIKKDEKLTPFKLNDIARKVFEQFGEMLKRRRQMDYYDSVSSYLSIHPTHPADDDEETHKKLDENSEIFKQKLSEVLDKFTKRAEGIEPEEIKSDVASNASSDISDDEQSSEKRDEEMNNIDHCSEELEENNVLNAVGLEANVSENQINDGPSGIEMQGDSVETLVVNDSNIQMKSSECSYESASSKVDEEDNDEDDFQERLNLNFIEKVLKSVMELEKEESSAVESGLKEISKDEKISSSRHGGEINSKNDNEESTSLVVNRESKTEWKKNSYSVECKSGSKQSVGEKTSEEYNSRHSNEQKSKKLTQTVEGSKKLSKDSSKISTKGNEEYNSKSSKEEISKSSTGNDNKKLYKDTSKLGSHTGISRKGIEENNSKHSKKEKSKSSTQTGNESKKISKDTSKFGKEDKNEDDLQERLNITFIEKVLQSVMEIEKEESSTSESELKDISKVEKTISSRHDREINSKNEKEERTSLVVNKESKTELKKSSDSVDFKSGSEQCFRKKTSEEYNTRHSNEQKSKKLNQTRNGNKKLSKDSSKLSSHTGISRKGNEENDSKNSKEEKSKSSNQTGNESKKIFKDSSKISPHSGIFPEFSFFEESSPKHSKEEKSKSSTQTDNESKKLSKDISKLGSHTGISRKGNEENNSKHSKEDKSKSSTQTGNGSKKLSKDTSKISTHSGISRESDRNTTVSGAKKRTHSGGKETERNRTETSAKVLKRSQPQNMPTLSNDEKLSDETNSTRTIDTSTSNIKSLNSCSVNSTADFINNNNVDLPMISAAFSFPKDNNIEAMKHNLAPLKLSKPSQTSSQTTKSSSDCSIMFDRNCAPEKRTNSSYQPMNQSASQLASSTSKQSVTSLRTKSDDADVSVITIDDENGNTSSHFRTIIEALGGPKFTSTPYKVDSSHIEQSATIHSQRPQSTRPVVNGKTKLPSDFSARQVLSQGNCKPPIKKFKLDQSAKKIDNTVITLD